MKRLGLLAVALAFAFNSDGAALKQVADGFTSPLVAVSAPGQKGKLVVADQIGVASVVGPDGKSAVFLDLRDKLVKLNQGFDERGLLGLAFHPGFVTNKKFYVYYSAPKHKEAPQGWDHTSHVSEFKVFDNMDKFEADPSSERVLLRIDQPYSTHNGGRIAFGPDGFLYIGMGDGGNANDAGKRPAIGNGQDLTTLLGKILRIDINKSEGYNIPKDNPFATNGKGRPEIYAYGVRNPWGLSFDRETKKGYFVDVGQTRWEEVNLLEKGANYGWRIKEHTECFNPKDAAKPLPECPDEDSHGTKFTDALFAYKNTKVFKNDPEAAGTSITGGYVYRGKAIPELRGKYIFADWSKHWVIADGVLFAASASGTNGEWTMRPLDLASHPKGEVKAYIVALGEDDEGELYVLTNGSNSVIGKSGKVLKLVP